MADGPTRNFGWTVSNFPLPAEYPNSFPEEVTIADFNGDGRADVLIAYLISPVENRTTPVKLLLGNGIGGFTDGTAAAFGSNVPSTVMPRDHALADFNGDGRPDLFIGDTGLDADPNPGFRNTLILSSGASGFVNATSNLSAVPDYTHSVAAGDIDGDGRMDVLVGNIFGGQANVYFLMGDGRGGFLQSFGRLPAAIEQRSGPDKFLTSVLFDADGDGDLDLFLGTHGEAGDTQSVLLRNDGQGRFLETIATTQSPAMPSGNVPNSLDVAAIDLDGDGRQDLVLLFGNSDRGVLQVLMNRSGGFVDETASRIADPGSTAFVRNLQLVDMNGDGYLDILLSKGADQPLYLNDGSGHFLRMPAGFVPGDKFDAKVAADLNGDGRMDIYSARGSASIASLAQDAGLTQTGTDSADGFMGDGDSETFNGLGGNDVIFAGAGDDTVSAGAGDDTVVGGAGVNYLRGDDGNDSIEGGSGFDDINGNQGNDTCVSGGGDDWVVGGKGDDSLVGSSGQNLVYGNLGNDTCDGGAGNDIVRGGQDNDSLMGGAGDDFVSGDKGDDTLSGGAGADVFHTFSDAGIDRVLDFSLAQGDRVQLDPGTQYTVSQLGADTVINMTGGAQMILVGVQMSTLTPGWIFGA